MGFNMYKEIPKIKEYLMIQGYKKNIPDEDFARSLMILFGMKKETVRKWLTWFEENKIISINDGVINFND